VDTATEHDAEPVAAAPASPGDDCGTDDPLVQRIADAIDRTVYVGGFHGPQIAAVRVLADHELRRALAAAAVVADLDRDHQPVRWAPDSPTVVCRAGCGAHPCHTRDVLDRMRQP
jgi:hypothetical protein